MTINAGEVVGIEREYRCEAVWRPSRREIDDIMLASRIYADDIDKYLDGMNAAVSRLYGIELRFGLKVSFLWPAEMLANLGLAKARQHDDGLAASYIRAIGAEVKSLAVKAAAKGTIREDFDGSFGVLKFEHRIGALQP